MNSLKMKISVILGVAQMALGVCMKAANNLYFREYVDFFFEFLPQIVMLFALFGYMDLLIILKWLTPYAPFAQNAPSIITTMIELALSGGYSEFPIIGTKESGLQQKISITLLLIALACVPIMLLVKPFWARSQMNHGSKGDHVEDEEVNPDQAPAGYGRINDDFPDRPPGSRTGTSAFNPDAPPIEERRGGTDANPDKSPAKRSLSAVEDFIPGEKSGGGHHGFGEIFIH